MRDLGDELVLSPVFGDSASSFVMICDPRGTPIDAISSRGVLSKQHPPCLSYSLAHSNSQPYATPQRLIAAVTDDEMQILYRLGIKFTSAAGLDTLSAEQACELFGRRRYKYVSDRPKYALTVPAWQMALGRYAVEPQTLRILEHLENIGRVSPHDPSTLIDVWIPTRQEFREIKNGLAAADMGMFSQSLQASRCTVTEALQFIRDRQKVDYGTARRRLIRSVKRSDVAPHAAEATAALNQFRRAFRVSVLDKFNSANSTDPDGWEQVRRLMGAEIAENWFAGQSIVTAAHSIIAGEFPRDFLTINLHQQRERLGLIETFAKLYALGQKTKNRRLAKVTTQLRQSITQSNKSKG